MYLCLLLFPLLSFLTTNLFGRYIGVQGAGLLAPLAIAATFSLSCVTFYEVVLSSAPCVIHLFVWFSGELLVCEWSFLFDTLSNVMLLVVSGVSFLVHIYSTDYMGSDPHVTRFLGYLSLFTFFMLILVTADNFLVMFFGWEGIGLASFLLISFWTNRIQAGKSAVKAMLVNRVGDVGLALGICYIFAIFKTVDYAVVFSLIPSLSNKTVTFLGFDFWCETIVACLLLWGAVGKSAQLGLHIWLPDAMEGPTPVSALIHAATLVTAGVFLIIRCSIIFEASNSTLSLLTLLGSVTCFFAGSVGLVQNDLKRIIAYSTCSQLGYMVFICGLSHYSVGLFHLANHAVFKALLFLSAGSVIHGLVDEQDIRKFGGIIRLFPVSYVMFLIGSLALTGFPFLTGFYSKDVILEVASAKHTLYGNFSHTLGCLAACFTSFYSFRLVILTFINRTNGYKVSIQNAHEGSIRLLFPLMVLGVGSIVIGFLTKDLMIGLGSTAFQNSIFVLPMNHVLIDSEFLNPIIKNLPLVFTIIGAICSWFLLYSNTVLSKGVILQYKLTALNKKLFVFLSKKWNFDQITNEILVYQSMLFGYSVSFQLFDKGIIEILGGRGLVGKTSQYSRAVSGLHSGFLSHSNAIFIVNVIILSTYAFLALLGAKLNISLMVLVLLYVASFNWSGVN